MQRRWRIGTCALLLLLGGWGARSSLALDEVTYEALLEKNQVALGEPVQFLIIVHYGIGSMAPQVMPPAFDKFAVLGENERTVNSEGQEEPHLIYRKLWILKPTETGHLSIGSAVVNYQDPTTNLLKSGKTQVQFLDVMPAASAPAPAEPGTTSAARAARGAPGWWLAAGIAAALLLGLVWGLRRPRRAARVPAEAPEDRALAALQQAVDHLESEDLAAYYGALTRGLLDYLQTRFALDANVLSTASLLEKLAGLGFKADQLAALETFLKTAERAKFAGYTPAEDEVEALHRAVTGFIEAGRGLRGQAARPSRPEKNEEDE